MNAKTIDDAEAPTALVERIHRFLQDQGMNATQLARRMGVSPQTMNNLLAGRTEPQVGTLALLAQATDIPLDELRTLAGKDRVRLDRVDPRVVNALYDDMIERMLVQDLDPMQQALIRDAIERARQERLTALQENE